MVGISPISDIGVCADFEFPMSDIVAVVPYVLPLLFLGTIFLLYQRYLRRDELRRNALVFFGIVFYVTAFLMLLYTGFGAVWWGPDELTFGSWWFLIGLLQAVTDIIFGSVLTSMVYLIIVVAVMGIAARYVIAPPDPDFVGLQEELKNAQESLKQAEELVQQLEAEKKQLTEQFAQREENLAELQSELESLKSRVESAEAEKLALAKQLEEAPAVSAEREQELLNQIAKKDDVIQSLQSEIDDLRLVVESKPEAAVDTERVSQLESELKTAKATVADVARRAETATEVSDSVISDLAELISTIEGSGLDPSAKIALTSLVKSLGRAMGRVSRPDDEKGPDTRVEMIGAVMMVHEIVDGIKKLVRSSK
ncbi:hypothetical protein EU546_00495 [Candidatus Thorarchaeota archaeon]|nr:MAG: hypothetical protein EU546_00495 [Candidatus Thorarchaeota archaeon]